MNDAKVEILIVDDDEADRELIIKSLKALEANIKETTTGAECLKALEEKEYGLILLDYKLPDVEGLDLITEIRKKTETPIIVVTGFGNEDLVTSTAALGVLDYIPKNRITPEFLTRTILNDLLIHKSKVDRAEMAAQLEKERQEQVNLLTNIIALAKEKLKTYEKQN
jgi:CheY-like chemotaxis protein